MESNFQDTLCWSNDNEIQKIIGNEKIYFSNKVLKFSSFSMKQDRNLVLTNKCLYNFQNKKIKRQMKYEEMLGITFSNQSNEFVIHANQGYDFHFVSPDKITIVYLIAKFYEKLMNKAIILCEVREKSLKQYVTTKKDKKKDINNSRLDENSIIDTQTFIIDNNPEIINKRTSSLASDGKINNLSIDLENPKIIKNKVIYSHDEKIKNVGFDDFNIIKLLGRGLSGKVFLVKNIFNKEYYALKSVSKNFFEINDLSLKIIQYFSKDSKFPFLINPYFCFETEDRIYFAFPYIQGEELLYYIKINKFLEEETIKLYSAIIGLSLDYLHNNGIKYKYFNSKNVIIDRDGYLKLVPFHIRRILGNKNNNNKNILEKNKNEYSPPEIFLENNEQNTETADWWNLGIIIYEMAYGIPPFYSDNDNEMKNIIINIELKFPKNSKISENLKDLIKKLLNKNYKERLGYNGFEEIKNHQFFKDFNFNDLLEKKIKPLYKPIIGDILEGNKTINKKYNFEDLQKIKL